MKAVVTPPDFGGKWSEFQAGTGITSDIGHSTRIGCALEPNGSVDPGVIEAVVGGPIAQRGSTMHYATSALVGFADEAAARSAIGVFRSSAWSACRVDQKTREETEAGPADNRWRVEPVDDAGRSRGSLQGIVRFQFQAVVDGELVDANGYETVLLYRVGRTVLIVAAEGVHAESDPKNLNAARDKELQAATTMALQRLRR